MSQENEPKRKEWSLFQNFALFMVAPALLFILFSIAAEDDRTKQLHVKDAEPVKTTRVHNKPRSSAVSYDVEDAHGSAQHSSEFSWTTRKKVVAAYTKQDFDTVASMITRKDYDGMARMVNARKACVIPVGTEICRVETEFLSGTSKYRIKGTEVTFWSYSLPNAK